MSEQECRTPAAFAVLTLAEIKAAARSFDDGHVSVFDALDAIMSAVEAYRHVTDVRRDAA
jgi:hypothetical protein